MYPKVSPCNPITATCDHVPALPPQSFYSCICLFVGSLINSCQVFTTPRWIQSQTLHYSNSQLFILFLLLLSHLSVSTFSTPILLFYCHSHTKAITINRSLASFASNQLGSFFSLFLFWFLLARHVRVTWRGVSDHWFLRHEGANNRVIVHSSDRIVKMGVCGGFSFLRRWIAAGKCGGAPPSFGARFGGGSPIGSGCFSARSPLLVWFCSSCSTITARIGSNSPFW